MEPQALLFFPGLDDFEEGLGEVIKKFQDAVLSVMNLVPDSYFDSFTRYMYSKYQYKSAQSPQFYSLCSELKIMVLQWSDMITSHIILINI